MSRNTKSDKKKKPSIKAKIQEKMKETANQKIDEFLERGDSLTKGDFVRLAKGMVKEQIDKKVPAPLKKSADPTGLPSVFSRSAAIGSAGASASKPSRPKRKELRKKRRAAKKQAKRRDKAIGLASFGLLLTVGILYKITSKL